MCDLPVRFLELFAHWPDAAFLVEVTAEGRFKCAAFNAAEERLIGVSDEQARGRYVEEILGEKTASPVVENFRRCVETAQPISYEEDVDLPAGRRQCATTLVPVLDAQGRVHRIVGHARDITEELAASRGLRASEESLRLLTDNIREVFWVVDPATSQVRYVSPAYEVIWGRSCESLRSEPRSWIDAVHLEDRARVEESFARQKDGPTETTYRIVRPDGSERWIRDRSFPVGDALRGVRKVVGLAEDVTSLVRAEERVRQADKFDALGRLAGGVAHDFNNLLAVIMSYVDLTLTGRPLDTQQYEDLTTVKRTAESAAELTRQLLTFSRQQVMQPRLVDVGRAILGMERLLQRVLLDDAEIVLRVAPVTAAVRIDPNQLEQVVMNLAINARDAMPSGGRLVIDVAEVVVRAEDPGHRADSVPPGRYVRLVVCDDGTGMTPETRARIFEPFFTTKERGRGTGLGLAIVFGIVERAGGIIQVTSAPGQGTSFTIHLPAAETLAGAPGPSSMAAPPVSGSGTILLVEDDTRVRAAARSILSRSGYAVIEAGNAGEALLICEQHPQSIDLLLTDVVMPRMSGPQLARRLSPLRPEMKVIYTSGYALEAEAIQGAIGPGDVFIAKPFTPLELTQRVRETLTDSRCPGQTGSTPPPNGSPACS